MRQKPDLHPDTHTWSGRIVRAGAFPGRRDTAFHRTWTPGRMRHAIAALKGRPVALTIDDNSGLTLFNVALVDVGCEGGCDWVSVYAQGRERQELVRYPLRDLGEAIIPVTDVWASWVNSDEPCRVAVESYTAEVEEAIRVARKAHGEGRRGGVWDGRCMLEGVVVTYQPHQLGLDPSDTEHTGWWATVNPDGTIREHDPA